MAPSWHQPSSCGEPPLAMPAAHCLCQELLIYFWHRNVTPLLESTVASCPVEVHSDPGSSLSVQRWVNCTSNALSIPGVRGRQDWGGGQWGWPTGMPLTDPLSFSAWQGWSRVHFGSLCLLHTASVSSRADDHGLRTPSKCLYWFLQIIFHVKVFKSTAL